MSGAGAGTANKTHSDEVIDYQEDLVNLVQRVLYQDDPEQSRYLTEDGRREMSRLSAQVDAIASRNEELNPEMEFYELEMQDVESKYILKWLEKSEEAKATLSEQTRKDFITGVKLNRKIIANASANTIERMFERGRERAAESEDGQRGVKRIAPKILESPPKILRIGEGTLTLTGSKRVRDEIETEQPGRDTDFLLTDEQLEVKTGLMKMEPNKINPGEKIDRDMIVEKKKKIRKKIREGQDFRERARKTLKQKLTESMKASEGKPGRKPFPATAGTLVTKKEHLRVAKEEVEGKNLKRERDDTVQKPKDQKRGRKVEDVSEQKVEKVEEPSAKPTPPQPTKTPAPIPPPPPTPAAAPAQTVAKPVSTPPAAAPPSAVPTLKHSVNRSQTAKAAAVPAESGGVEESKETEVEERQDAMHVEDFQGEPVHVGGEEPEGGDGGDGGGDGGPSPPPPAGDITTGVEGEGGETAGDGADGRDDLLSPDEAKTLLRDEFQWRVEDTKYFTKASRGKIGYGQGGEANVQPIQPFGTTLKESPDESQGESVFKQRDSRFEPFRGQHEIVQEPKGSKQDGGAGEEIMATAMTPFAKIGGQVIWIPFYAKAVKMYFTAQDFEELVSNVTEQRGKLKLKAPNPSVIQNMQKTVDQVRTSLRPFEVFPLKVRHENLTTRYAEWLELRQIMKAVAKYQKSTSGMYNQSGLFSGSLREAVSKAIDDAVGMVGKKQKKTLGRGLEGVGATQSEGAAGRDEAAEFQAFNPFQVRERALKKSRTTLPRFF